MPTDREPRQTDDESRRDFLKEVTFSYGRDLRLEPPQAGPKLNYFVLPHVEVDGRPVDKAQLDWKLEYQDLPAQTRD